MRKLLKILFITIWIGFTLANVNVVATGTSKLTEDVGKIKGIKVSEKVTAQDKASPPKTAPDYYSMIDNPTLASKGINPVALNEIEENCDTIIEGTFREVVKQEDEHNSIGKRIYSYTRSSVQVDKVYAGTVKEGDTLALLEPYCIESREGKTYLTHYENYYPSEAGKQYLWFLRKVSVTGDNAIEGFTEPFYYNLVLCERGRYPIVDTKSRSTVDIAKMSNQDLSLSPGGDTTVYKNIYNEVIDKYMKN